jgi:TfoX/Sxy family transcriptional regulator of competence genes
MAFPSPDPSLCAALAELLPDRPDVSSRKMFGCPALFLGEHMFGGVFGDCLNLRLSEADRAEALTLPGVHPFVPNEGRPMREYICLPPELALEPSALAAWADRAIAYARTLPAKRPRPKSSGKRSAD